MRFSERAWDVCVVLIVAVWLAGLIAWATGWHVLSGWLVVFWPTLLMVQGAVALWLLGNTLYLWLVLADRWETLLWRSRGYRAKRFLLPHEHGHDRH